MYPYIASEEHCFHALRALALTDGPLQHRLAEATFAIGGLQEGHYEPELWPSAHALMEALTQRESTGNEGRIIATTRAMSDQDAKNYIVRLIELSARVFRLAGAARAQGQG